MILSYILVASKAPYFIWGAILAVFLIVLCWPMGKDYKDWDNDKHK